MSQQELLKIVVKALENANIQYMITGSIVSSLQGEPRLTHDIVSSPEDTILAKLRWAKMAGGSEKHFIDALRVYEVQYERLDMGYIDRWAQKLGVEGLWKRIKDEAEII